MIGLDRVDSMTFPSPEAPVRDQHASIVHTAKQSQFLPLENFIHTVHKLSPILWKRSI